MFMLNIIKFYINVYINHINKIKVIAITIININIYINHINKINVITISIINIYININNPWLKYYLLRPER